MHNLLTLLVMIMAVTCATVFSVRAEVTDQIGQTRASSDAQDRIQGIFNNIESIGNSYDGGGASAGNRAVIDAGCRAAVEQFLQSRLFSEVKAGLLPTDLNVPDIAKEYLNGKSQEIGQSTFNNLCAALQGDQIETVDIDHSLKKGLRSDLAPRLIAFGQSLAQASGLPFLSRLEIQTGVSDRRFFSSITSVQPIWADETDHHHVFAQVSWYDAETNTNDLGFNKEYNTFNAGMAYRYLTTDKNYLYGANIFFDHAPKMNHNRMSLGLDARTSQLALSANRYFPLSDWKKLDLYYEEKVAGGWDLQLRGQVPSLPSWTASVKGYQWDDQDDGEDLYGATASIEYSPVPALAVSMGVNDDSQGSPSLEAALRFTYRFDQPKGLQFRERAALAPVSDYVYEKVQRENIIRVKQQRRSSSKLTVIQTTGANIAQEDTGNSSLSVGKTLLMPTTVTVANTVGAIARLRFADGSVLSLAQNTQVTIVPDQITLVYGTMQYTNNGAVTTILVPGGTIALHGTDLDIVSDGTDTSVRVRDGMIDFVGTVSGAAALGAEDAAESISGVVGTLASGSTGYVDHTDVVSVEIDRIAPPTTGSAVTPYPYEAPRIIGSNMTVGGQIVFGLRFNDVITVSGGTPQLHFTINGNSRVANYVSGSGTKDLRFSYINVVADISATSLTVNGLDKNGASIRGNGKDAVTTIADATLSVTGTGDVTAPAGYAVAFTTDPINNANKAAAAISISSAEVGAVYNYTISSSGGGTNVTASGTIATTTQVISGINLTGLSDGTLTVSVTLTDSSSNVGTAATDTVAKDVAAPTGYTVAFTTDPINNTNKAAASITLSAAEVGTTYSYSITDGTTTIGPVTGTVATATQVISGIDLTTLADTTLTVSVTLTDSSSNVGTAATDTVAKDVAVPSGYTLAFTTTPINSGNQAAASITISSAEVGTTYSYTITDGTTTLGAVTGTVASATQVISGIDVSSLADTTLTASATLTDASANTGVAATGTVAKDTSAPASYTVAFTTDPINNANKAAASITISTAEVGSTYSYTVTDGSTTIGPFTGSVASATQVISGINLTTLADTTLTVSLTLTDAGNNTGAAATDTVQKDVAAPTGYGVVFTTDPINNANKAAASITLSSAEVGTTYSYTVTDGSTTVGPFTGTVVSASQVISGINLTTLADTILTVSLTLTDAANNTGTAATDTVAKDVAAPTGYSVVFTTDPISNANKAAAAISISSAEVGTTYNYTISSSGGGTNVTGSGTIATATQSVTGIDLTGLSDGTLTVSVTLTDTNTNVGTAVTDTVVKDVAAPTGYSVVFTTDPINNANKAAASITVSAAEVGATYSYTVTDGTTTVGPFTGTIATATQLISGINLTTLADTTLTVSLTLTDTGSNLGAAVTDTVVKDVVAPTITSVTPPANATYEP